MSQARQPTRWGSIAVFAIISVILVFFAVNTLQKTASMSTERKETQLETDRRLHIYYRSLPAFAFGWEQVVRGTANFSLEGLRSQSAGIGYSTGRGFIWEAYEGIPIGYFDIRYAYSGSHVEPDSFCMTMLLREKHVLKLLSEPYKPDFSSPPIGDPKYANRLAEDDFGLPYSSIGSVAHSRLRELKAGGSTAFQHCGMEWHLALDSDSNLRVQIRSELPSKFLTESSKVGYSKHLPFQNNQVKHLYEVLREDAFVDTIRISEVIYGYGLPDSYSGADLMIVTSIGHVYRVRLGEHTGSLGHTFSLMSCGDRTLSKQDPEDDLKDSFKTFYMRGSGYTPRSENNPFDSRQMSHVTAEELEMIAETGLFPPEVQPTGR